MLATLGAGSPPPLCQGLFVVAGGSFLLLLLIPVLFTRGIFLVIATFMLHRIPVDRFQHLEHLLLVINHLQLVV